MTLNPRLQQLSSRIEEGEALTLTQSEPGAKGRLSGSLMARKLNEWAESHQGRFGMKSIQHGLTEMDMGIVHEETLQAGSDIEEYRKFLDQLRARASIRETEDALPLWMIQLGLGCALLSTCWVGGQLGYKGFQTI